MAVIKMNFDTDIAKEVGTDAAIIFSNIEFWVGTNKANKQNFFDGKYWMYNSTKAFSELFDYLSESQIKTCLSKLEKSNYIEYGNYNKSSYDRTKWYAIVDKSTISEISPMEQTEMSNGLDENRQTIPNNKTDNKTNKDIINFDKLIVYYNSVYNRKVRIVPADVKKAFNLRIKEGYLKEDIVKVIDNCFNDQHHIDTNYNYATLEFLSRPKIFARYAAMEHKKPTKETKQTGYQNF